MIQKLEIEPSYKTPRVNFDPEHGEFKIEGNSILVNVEEFYEPLLQWMQEFKESTSLEEVHFRFDIAYTNVASTKRFLFFLYKLQELTEKNIEVKVDWLYAENDQYVLETGKVLSQMLNIPFNFIGYEKLHRKDTFIA